MVRRIYIGLALAAVLHVAASPEGRTPVFPDAKGFGIHTRAGRGGKVIRVTNLHSEGPGSLRKALRTKGPRIVIFEVGGVIDLRKKNLVLSEPFLTLAGQTAPSPGITIIRGGMVIRTHDILIQHIRVRPGDAGESKRSGWEPDGISTFGGDAYNVVIDHCSVSWAVDENVSTSGPETKGPDAASHSITVSNCIIAECLDISSHKSGPHSMGSLISDFCTNIAIIGNLYAHNARRNPYFMAHTTGIVMNNVIYNPGSAAIQVGYIAGRWKKAKWKPQNCRISVIGNVMIHGKNTQKNLALVASRGDVYLEDNIALDGSGRPVPLTAGKINILRKKPVWPKGLQALPAGQVIGHVVKHAGARPKDRDEIDKRIIQEFLERKGHIINSQRDVGGYAMMKVTRHRLEVPEKNVEDWLAKLASDLE